MRRHTKQAATLDGFTVAERLALLTGWLPPGQGAPHPRAWSTCRWSTWAGYLADARRLAPVLAARYPHHHGQSYAALVVAYADRHGLAALSTASYTSITEAA